MRIKITRQTVANKTTVRPGEIVEVPEGEARLLISGRKAEFFRDDAAPSSGPFEPRPDAPRRKPRQKGNKP